MRGPVEYLVVSFPGNQFKGEILPELEKVVDQGLVKIIDLVLVVKDEQGNVQSIELNDADDSISKALGGVSESIEGLLSTEDIEEIGEILENNSSAGILVFEHSWAKGFKEAIVNAGGELVVNARVPSEIVDEADKATGK